MTRIYDIWRYTFYIQPIMEMLLIVTFIISLRERNRFHCLKLIPLFLGTFTCIVLMKYAGILLSQNGAQSGFLAFVDRYLVHTVSLAEFICFFCFLYFSSKPSVMRRILKLSGIIGIMSYVLAYETLIVIDSFGGLYFLNDFYIITSVILLIMSLVHLVDLYRNKEIHDLTSTANFWMLAGLVTYLISTLPYRLLCNYFFVRDPALFQSSYALLCFFYMVLFFSILWAYQSKTSIQFKSSKSN